MSFAHRHDHSDGKGDFVDVCCQHVRHQLIRVELRLLTAFIGVGRVLIGSLSQTDYTARHYCPVWRVRVREKTLERYFCTRKQVRHLNWR